MYLLYKREHATATILHVSSPPAHLVQYIGAHALPVRRAVLFPPAHIR